jgi:TPP-dependent trihydroxycyclohexane-1,2-dione (THcHDO) dehydratase
LLNGGPWDNALLYTPMNQFANMNTTYNNFYNPQSNWFQSVHKPADMWKILQVSLITPAQDPVALRQVTDWLVNDCTTIPLDYPAAMWAVTNKVQDSGLGLRGASTYWNTENVWLSK